MSESVTLTRQDQFVIMQTPGFHLHFDTLYGGTPLSWYVKENSQAAVLVTNPFPGAGTSINWETGQDPTQATPNGPDQYPIARLDQPNVYLEYYAAELAFKPPAGSGGEAVYKVGGVAPFFWLSHQSIDDTIPTDPAHNNENGWVTLYHNLEQFPPTVFSDFGTPIFFKGTPNLSSGIIFIGNEMVQANAPWTPWNQALCPIPEGRVAAYVNISFAQASPDCLASLMIRRDVTQDEGATIEDAYKSPGYFLNVNYAGELALTRSDGSGCLPVQVWGGSVIQSIKDTILTDQGVQLEVRTYIDTPAKLEIWVNKTCVGAYEDSNPILGENFALFAQATGGLIKFSKRNVFDMGKTFTATYTGLPSGEVQFDYSISNSSGVSHPENFYRTNMPGIFLAETILSPVVRAWDPGGNEIDLDKAFPDPNTGKFCGIVPILREPAYVSSMWLGSSDGTQGVYTTPLSADINGVKTTESHAGLFLNPTAVLALNALPDSANTVPVSVSSVTLSSLWKASYK